MTKYYMGLNRRATLVRKGLLSLGWRRVETKTSNGEVYCLYGSPVNNLPKSFKELKNLGKHFRREP